MKSQNYNINNNVSATDTIQQEKTVAIVGMPQSGKSTLFRLLTDIKSHGYDATFEIIAASTKIKNRKIQIVDLPGIQSFASDQFSEKIAINFIINNKIDLIVNMVDSTNLARGLKLTVELLDLGIPMIIVLNFQDESLHRGIKINDKLLSKNLGCKVIQMQARAGKGINDIAQTIDQMLNAPHTAPKFIKYNQNIEQQIAILEGAIKENNIKIIANPRFYAFKAMENPTFIPEFSSYSIQSKIADIEKSIIQELNQDPYELISHYRHNLANEIANDVTEIRSDRIPFQDKADALISHPILGYGILILVLGSFFLCIFLVGNSLSKLLEIPLLALGQTFAPLQKSSPFLWFSINGAYQGINGAIGIVLPYFLPLVLLTSIMEETGYMSRLVLLTDELMHKIGLHGKSIIPLMLGIGCSVPALYATRMLENRRDRIITAILIPFIPCSARLTVIFALAAAFTGPFWAAIIFLYIMLIIGLMGKVFSRVMPDDSGLTMQIVPLKFPSLKNLLIKTWLKIRNFLGDALVFLILGGIVLGWVEYFNVSSIFDTMFSPIISGLLDLPEKLGSTLVFGFFRKELVLVMTYQALGVSTLSNLPMTVSQVVIFVIFVCLYFPCLSTFIVLWKEFKWKVAISSAVFSLLLATFSAYLFKIVLSFIYV